MKPALGAEGGDAPAAQKAWPRDHVFLMQAQNETAPGSGNRPECPAEG